MDASMYCRAGAHHADPQETRLMSITPLDMKAVHLHDRCVALVPAPALSISAGNLHYCSLSLLLLSAY